MHFENPHNGHVQIGSTRFTWLWCLLWGPIYFLVKGAWKGMLISIVMALLTFGLSAFVMPFFARSLVDNSYLNSGWRKVTAKYS